MHQRGHAPATVRWSASRSSISSSTSSSSSSSNSRHSRYFALQSISNAVNESERELINSFSVPKNCKAQRQLKQKQHHHHHHHHRLHPANSSHNIWLNAQASSNIRSSSSRSNRNHEKVATAAFGQHSVATNRLAKAASKSNWPPGRQGCRANPIRFFFASVFECGIKCSKIYVRSVVSACAWSQKKQFNDHLIHQ